MEAVVQAVKFYKIFVAGIPSRYTSTEIKLYFASFGAISSVEMVPRSSQRRRLNFRSNNDKKGAWIISVETRDVFDRILNHYPHRFSDRNLICKPFLYGPELAQTNSLNNKRRVILKHVPTELSEESLRSMLIRDFGDIECLFSFRPDKQPTVSKRQYHSYSVMFMQEHSAVKAIQAGSLNYSKGSSPIKVEQFCIKKKKKLLPSKSNSKAKRSGDEPSPKSFVFVNTRDLLRSPSCPSLKGSQEEGPFEHFLSCSNFDRSEQQNRPKRSRSLDIQEDSFSFLPELAIDLLNRLHSVKPNQKPYHCFRNPLVDYACCFNPSFEMTSHSNIRYNKFPK